MIHVDRTADAEKIEEALTKPFANHDNKTELERAREYYNAIPPPKKAFEFARYKEWDVCRELDKMFHEKCAYCESKYRAVDSCDVEHFRPKGKVKEAPIDNLGYWWLAAVWRNLLPSCPPCNQRRKQAQFQLGMTLDDLEKALQKKPRESSGKANSFPLADENWITDETAPLDAEDPLLINPCEKEPSDYLDWLFDWDQTMKLWDADPIYPIVVPKQLKNGKIDPHGESSIAIYGLNRSGLFRARMERIQEINMHCQTIVEVMKNLGGGDIGPEGKEILRDLLVKHKKTLYNFCLPQKEFSGMAREFVKLFESKLPEL